MNLNATLFAQCIVFFILALFTMKYIWPPLIQALDQRAKAIAEGLAAADQAKYELAHSMQCAEEELKKARQTAIEIISHAEKRSEECLNEAHIKAKQIVSEARSHATEEIDALLIKAKDDLKSHMASLVIASSEKILREEIDASKHAKILLEIERQL